MKLRVLSPPDWSISRNLAKWARKLRIPLSGPAPMKGVIIIGNGTPDDIVCLILCHKFDGKQVVGVTKPEAAGIKSAIYAALRSIREKINNLMVILDQEEKKEKEFWNEIEDVFKKEKVEFEVIEKEEKFRVYACSQANYKFKVAVLANGLTNKQYKKHTIEDHLLELSMSLENVREDVEGVLRESEYDPKEAWKKLREKHREVHREVFSHLLNASKDEIRLYFPQHVRALEIFRKIIERREE
ncbi:MAG: hypothetical protein N2V74_07650 [Candidatus Methanospirare jalkutatii]|nr:MAG: hypothetical protein N2V74_07650 [Candidatus Methanospirare jalkutatii]